MKNFTLLTGACGGLGREFFKLLAKNNENLLLTGTSETKLNSLLEEFKENLADISVLTFVCDLAKSEDRKNLMAFIKEKEININKLINNAGVIIEGALLNFEDDEILNAIEVNCIGTLDLTQKIIKARDKSQKLEILTVASLASNQPIPYMAVYSATKSFLVSMMTALSVELKNENVIISTVCPSGMATTEAMKRSIESMGLNGKLTTLPVNKIAKIALNGLKKGKTIVIPGKFNKFVAIISKPLSQKTLAKFTGRMWEKSQKERGIFYKKS